VTWPAGPDLRGVTKASHPGSRRTSRGGPADHVASSLRQRHRVCAQGWPFRRWGRRHHSLGVSGRQRLRQLL